MDVVDAVVVGLPGPLAGEDVDLVPAPLQPGRQFGHVSADAADRDGVKRFPRKQSDTHAPFSYQGNIGFKFGGAWRRRSLKGP
jgi:hypothetical protein